MVLSLPLFLWAIETLVHPHLLEGCQASRVFYYALCEIFTRGLVPSSKEGPVLPQCTRVALSAGSISIKLRTAGAA